MQFTAITDYLGSLIVINHDLCEMCGQQLRTKVNSLQSTTEKSKFYYVK